MKTVSYKKFSLLTHKKWQDKKSKIDTEGLISAIVKTLKNKQLEAKMRRNSLISAQCYNYRRVLPRLVRLLKKRPQCRPKERWSLIKDKTVADFRSSFNQGFFFFINFDSHFRKKAYAAYIRTFCQHLLLREKGLCALQKEYSGAKAGIWQ